MKQQKKYNYYKWMTLLTFSLMYNMVYLGRFNLNNMMGDITAELNLTEFQQSLISLSVFLSYAGGCLINGWLADKYGAKRFALLGVAVSILCNVTLSFAHRWQVLLALWTINGFFQSMIWIGGVIIMVNWWQARERGKGVGIANFFSGLSHVTAYLVPAAMLAIFPAMTWRYNLTIPMGLLGILAVIFYCFSVEKPEDKSLSPYNEPDKKLRNREKNVRKEAIVRKTPYGYLFGRKRFIWWCAIAMLSSICRYGLLNWIPRYYALESGEMISEAFSNITLPLGMAFGTLVLTWIAGTRMYKNKGIVVIFAAALCGTLIVIFPMITDPQIILTGIFFTGFFLYGINGVLWLYAMDEGLRVFSGTAAGILNCCAYMGASMEVLIFPRLIAATGEMISIFVAMEMFCVAMVVCGMVVCRKNTEIEPEIRE